MLYYAKYIYATESDKFPPEIPVHNSLPVIFVMGRKYVNALSCDINIGKEYRV